MKTLQELLQERTALVEAQAALVNTAQAADRLLTEEETASFEALDQEIESKDGEITALEKHQARLSKVSDRVKDLAKPASQNNRSPVVNVRERILDKPWRSLGEQMLAVYHAAVPGNPADPRLMASATGMGANIPSDGGFLVHTDFAETMLQRTYDEGILASRVERLPLGEMSDSIKIPAVDETSRADGSRMGGIRAYWADEGDEKTASKPKFRLVDLKLKKLIGLAYAPDELLKDATSLGAWVMRAFSGEFAFKIDDMIYRGNGAGKGLGLLNAPALVTVPKETGQAASTVVFENIMKMWSRCYGRSRANSNWYINQDVEPQLFGMSMTVGTGGVPVYMPAGGISGQPYGTLFGRPVIPIEHADTVGTVGDIVLADLSQYLMIDKEAMESAVSIHVRFIYDESTFRFVYRCDGAPWWNSALTPFKGTNTQSPFVALATR